MEKPQKDQIYLDEAKTGSALTKNVGQRKKLIHYVKRMQRDRLPKLAMTCPTEQIEQQIKDDPRRE
jgi:hypothetical protein